MVKRRADIAKRILFFDFDNTITKFDVLDDMLERFSADDTWLELEKRWKLGEIGSRQCLDGQMRGIRITRCALDKYLNTIKLDPSFKKILKFCDENSIKKVIVSDNFDYIIGKVLDNNGIEGLDIYCNSIKLAGGKLLPRFPHTNKDHQKCAHCKTKSILKNIGEGSASIYIGDGLSDVCPSKKTGLIFAKDSLKKRLEADKVPYVPFDDLGDVYKYLKRRIT